MKPQKITMDGRELINRLKIINSKMPSADELNPDLIDLFNLFGELGLYDDMANAACARLIGEQCLGWEGCYSSSPSFKYIQDMLKCNQ